MALTDLNWLKTVISVLLAAVGNFFLIRIRMIKRCRKKQYDTGEITIDAALEELHIPPSKKIAEVL